MQIFNIDLNTANKKVKFLFGAGILLCAMGLAAIFTLLFRHYYSADELRSAGVMAFRFIIFAVIAYGFFTASLYYLTGGKTAPPAQRIVIKQLGIGMALALLTAGISLVTIPALYYHASKFQAQPLLWVFLLFLQFICVAIVEEVLCRGVLQRFLCLFLPVPVATVLQAIYFAWMHGYGLNTAFFCLANAQLFCFGLFMTLLSKRSPYLILPIAYHTFENFFFSVINPAPRFKFGMDVDGIWNLSELFNGNYRVAFAIAYSAIFVYWYGWSGQGRKKVAP
jgi:membrane protease YdiL (CAAX protease family)